jgi:arylsulfatase A-like enzyme
VHSPYQLPPSWEIKNFTNFPFATYANMLNMLDESVRNLTTALQETQMWDETLLVFSADNGGIGELLIFVVRAWGGGGGGYNAEESELLSTQVQQGTTWHQ